MHFRSVERALYDLGSPPDAAPAGPRRFQPVSTHPPRPGPRGPFRESVRRLDLSIAARQLNDEERQIIRDHYLTRARVVSRKERAPVVNRLITILGAQR